MSGGDPAGGLLHGRSRHFMELFGLRIPIIQAPMDGPVTPDLAAAVTNAGALGSLPLTWLTADQVPTAIESVRAQTNGLFFGNYVLSFEPKTYDLAIDAGVPAIQFSWGIPTAAMIDRLRERSLPMGIQVTDADSAKQALDLGADFLVCQGIEAGGHVQAYQPLHAALEEALAVAGEVPVAASGGMATGHDIRRWISMGAAAAVLGTRFVATQESVAHPRYKQMLLDGTGGDTVFTVCLNKEWPNATHRIFRNDTFRMWNAAGCPPAGRRPGEHDVIAVIEDTDPVQTFVRYLNNTPVESMTGDDVMGLGVFAGLGVGEIDDLPSVDELVGRLWREFLEAPSQQSTSKEAGPT